MPDKLNIDKVHSSGMFKILAKGDHFAIKEFLQELETHARKELIERGLNCDILKSEVHIINIQVGD